MAICTNLSCVYGAYLMSPRTSRDGNNVNKNSYGRLINSYYGRHSLYKQTLACENDSAVFAVNENAKAVSDSLDMLAKESALYEVDSKEELEESVIAFVEGYNGLIQSFSNTGEEEFSERSNVLDSINQLREVELNAVGIYRNQDQTLSIDTSWLAVADQDDFKLLFCGENSYASHMSAKANQLGKEALASISPVPNFYGDNGNVTIVILPGTLFNGYI